MGTYSGDLQHDGAAAGSATSKSSHIARRFIVVLAMCTTVLVSLAATPSVSATQPTSNLLHSASLEECICGMNTSKPRALSYGEEV
jgi:hypothetical protein